MIKEYIHLRRIKGRLQSVRKEKLAFIQHPGNEINVISFWEFEVITALTILLFKMPVAENISFQTLWNAGKNELRSETMTRIC